MKDTSISWNSKRQALDSKSSCVFKYYVLSKTKKKRNIVAFIISRIGSYFYSFIGYLGR